MPWPTYSERFLLYSHPELGSNVYVVPDRMRAVIKCVTAVNYSGVRAGCRVRAHGHSVAYIDFQVPKVTDTLLVFIVVYARQQIDVFLDNTPMACSVSGFLFDDPSNAGGPPAAATQLPAVDEIPAEPMAHDPWPASQPRS